MVLPAGYCSHGGCRHIVDTQPIRDFETFPAGFGETKGNTLFRRVAVLAIPAYTDHLSLLCYNRKAGTTWLRVSHIMHPMSRRNFPHGGVFQGMWAAAVWLCYSLYDTTRGLIHYCRQCFLSYLNLKPCFPCGCHGDKNTQIM